MGARGPARTPTAKLKLRGSWLAAEREKTEPQFTPGVGEPPVKLTGEALKEWRRAVEELGPSKVLTMADRSALAMYCEAWADYRELVEDYKACRKSEPNRMYLDVRAAVRLARESASKLGQQFGLTPAVRSRVQASESKAPAGKLSKFRTA